MKNLQKTGAMAALAATILALSGFGASASAEERTEAANPAGVYFAVPIYLYERFSASGIQLGWQTGNWHMRIDLGLIDVATKDSDALIAYPSLGVFYSHDWEARLRTYEGVAIGVEAGIANAFEGRVLTLNILTGAEWFASRGKSFYLELGSGIGFFRKEGAFNGGTVVGGGMKCYL